ncbi:MAG: hypothetical protein IPL96_11745 [Holophagaceae bacterium]|nr:hypothetical protein [Holophagaceae bacterium]
MKILLTISIILVMPSIPREPRADNPLAPAHPPSLKKARRIAETTVSEFIKVIGNADEVTIDSLSSMHLTRQADGTYIQEYSVVDHSVSISNPEQIQRLIQILKTSPATGGGVTGCMTDLAKFKIKGQTIATMGICEGQHLRFSIPSPDVHIQNPVAFRAWFVENKVKISLPQ